MFRFLGLNPKTIYYNEWIKKFPDLSNKTVAITGTTSGCGFAAASAAVKCNVRALYLLNRDSGRSQESFKKLSELRDNEESKTQIFAINCDLASFESVRSAAEEINAKVESLDVLALNAGVMAFPDERTKDGFDLQMQINHLSHFLLSKLLLPSLLRSDQARIVVQSSSARYLRKGDLDKKYLRKCAEGSLGGDELQDCFQRYHQSKLSNSAFVMALQQKIVEKGIEGSKLIAVGSEPGLSITGLGGNLLNAHKKASFGKRMKMKVGSLFILYRAMKGSLSAEDGSLPLLEGMFGETAKSGDFIMPEKGFFGAPTKSILEGAQNLEMNIDETATIDKENQKTVWDGSEELFGDFFEFME